MNCEHYRNDFRLIARYKFMQALDSRADNQVIERLGEWVGRFSVTAISPTNPGTGYRKPPTITLVGGNPTNIATAQAGRKSRFFPKAGEKNLT